MQSLLFFVYKTIPEVLYDIQEMLSKVLLYFGQTTWLTAKITIRIMRAIVILKEVNKMKLIWTILVLMISFALVYAFIGALLASVSGVGSVFTLIGVGVIVCLLWDKLKK